jgi:hypothetical protein
LSGKNNILNNYIAENSFHSALSFFDQSLPDTHFPPYTKYLPLPAHLFSLQQRSFTKTWAYKRREAGHQKNFQLSSVGW